MARKICFLTYCPSGGGAATFVRMGLIYLAPKAQVTLIDELPEQIVQRVSPQTSQRITVAKLPLWSNPSTAAKQFWDYLEIAQPDWIVVDNPGLLFRYYLILRRAWRKWGTCTQFTVHSGVLTATPRRELVHVGASLALLRTNRVTYVSGYTQRHWHRKYPWTRLKSTKVIHNGIPLPDVSLRSPNSSSSWRVGFVGRLDHEKDPILFCKIAEFSKSQGKDIQFHAFGSGPLMQELESQFRTVVVFHGVLRDLATIYSLIDVLVVSSPVENCPYVVLEAKSFGIPTVAAAVGGLPEIVSDGVDGILCQRRDAPSFLKAIEQVISRYREFKNNSIENRERFSLEYHGHQMWDTLLRT